MSVNGRPVQRVYDATARTYTDTSPEGRQVVTTLDSKGRVIETQQSGLHPVRQSYDIFGRVNQLKYGPDPDTAETRTTTIDYVDDFDVAFDDYPTAAEGEIKTITDAANRTTRFEYDGAARVTRQVMPDGSAIEIHYDQNGNVTSIQPPGRPIHSFTYTAANQQKTYTPPQVSPADPSTTYTYTGDRKLDLVTRPDGEQIDYHYDPAGRLDQLVLLPSGETHDYVYDPTSGNLSQMITPDATLELGYDGSLPTGEAWSGAELTAASVTRGYDPSFRPQSQQVAVGATSQPAINFGYDDDDLLTQAGALTLTPDPANGLLRATTMTDGANTVSDATDYTSFGEVQHYLASDGATDLFERSYTRDDLGRITSITETVTLPPDPPETTVRHYKYDQAGRLWRVCPDDACTTISSEYLYDANGNRLPGTSTPQGTITSAVYDDQDRLLSLVQGLTAPATNTPTTATCSARPTGAARRPTRTTRSATCAG